MTLKTLRDNLLWIIFFLCVATYAQARNDYLNDYGTCERGSWETYTEVRQHEYKSGTNDEYQDFEFLKKGEYLIELEGTPSLGICRYEEELAILYKSLTKQNIE